MTIIINKSNHPVQVKRIDVRIWKFRDEIEKALAIRLDEAKAAGIEVDIEDIRAFYSRSKPAYLNPDYDPEEDDNERSADVLEIGQNGKDSSGNEMDDDALEMMAALKGEEEGEESSESEDDAAAKLAAQMLGDQAPTSSEAEDEAAKLAAEMLGDQAPQTEEKSNDNKIVKTKELKRILPDKDKLSSGFTLLSDLNMDNVLIFSKEKFTHGQNISIELLIPNSFIISAEVDACVHMARKSKIISESKPRYRVEATLTYLWEGERTNLRNFLKSVEPTVPPLPKKMKRPDSGEDDGDEFEDLGF